MAAVSLNAGDFPAKTAPLYKMPFSMVQVSRKAHPKEEFKIRTLVLNVANRYKDKKFNPWVYRVPHLIRLINTYRPDAVSLIEAGPSSSSVSFTEVAALIEKGTGLELASYYRSTATHRSDGKALFIDPSSVVVLGVERLWTSGDGTQGWGGPEGNDVLRVSLNPVREGLQIHDRKLVFGVVKLPIKVKDKLAVTQWLVERAANFDQIVGVTNVYEHAKQEQLALMETTYTELLPKDTYVSYRDYEYSFKVLKEGEVIPPKSVALDGARYLHSEWVDHSYRSKESGLVMSSFLTPLDFSISDHCAIVTDVRL